MGNYHVVRRDPLSGGEGSTFISSTIQRIEPARYYTEDWSSAERPFVITLF